MHSVFMYTYLKCLKFWLSFRYFIHLVIQKLTSKFFAEISHYLLRTSSTYVKKFRESFFKYFQRIEWGLWNSLHHPTTVARVELCSLTLSGSLSLSFWTLRRFSRVEKWVVGYFRVVIVILDELFSTTFFCHLLHLFDMRTKKRKLFKSISAGCSNVIFNIVLCLFKERIDFFLPLIFYVNFPVTF